MFRKFFLLFASIGFILMMTVNPVDCECCRSAFKVNIRWKPPSPPNANAGIIETNSYCEDGTNTTPCCGYGKCNAFCCNCKNGCRKDNIGSWKIGSVVTRKGQIQWSSNCDFRGYDIAINYAIPTSECWARCLSNSSCNAFTYNSGTCYLKKVPKNYERRSATGSSLSCGIVNPRY